MEREPGTGVPDEARLLELVHNVRDAIDGAKTELHHTFYAGVCFLLRWRLGRDDIEERAGQLLDAVAQRIREDSSINGSNLPNLVRKILLQNVQAGSSRKSLAERPNGYSVAAAQKVLGSMSTVERDALRRCYVLGEPPESFLSTLKLTPEQFRSIRGRARSEFSNKTRELNVA